MHKDIIESSLKSLKRDISLSLRYLSDYVDYEIETSYEDYDCDEVSCYKSLSEDYHQVVLSDLNYLYKFGLIDDRTKFLLLEEYISDREKIYSKFLEKDED